MFSALALVILLSVPAGASNPPYYGYYQGCGSWPYFPPGGYAPERLPHYALYPPVYYSFPVARTYGYSPFAYPPGVATPDPNFAAASADRALPPLRIANPFVAGTEVTRPSEPARADSKPVVVYPATGRSPE